MNPMHNYLSIVQRLAEVRGMATAASLQAEVDHREVLADIADLAGEVNEDLQEAVLRGGGVRIGGGRRGGLEGEAVNRVWSKKGEGIKGEGEGIVREENGEARFRSVGLGKGSDSGEVAALSTHYYAHEHVFEDRIYLAKRAGGWKPILHWHAGFDGCPCYCEQHHYRNWDEFKQFVRQDEVIITNEYGEELDADEFINMLVKWREENDRSHLRESSPTEGREIDGWEFVGGYWE